MNTDKISPDLLDKVSILGKQDLQEVVISSCNFDEAKNFLRKFKFRFTPYRFASCFCLPADFDDIDILSNQKFVNYIYSNSVVKVESAEQDLMNTRALTENKYFGQGQTICFIDTGVCAHLDFIFPKTRLIKFIDLINSCPTPYDDNGHGTFVSGVACGRGIFDKRQMGFAHKANLIVIKALGANGSSNSNKILDAMQWVYENCKAYNISVVCMSFGADVINGSDPLSRGAESLWKRGIVVVAAAGNSGPDKSTIKSPGNNPYIITVGGLDEKTMSVADFSSCGPTIYGHKPDMLAPAVDITSCSNHGLPYTVMSGTSVATPIVAGICAIIKSRYPKMTNNEIKNFLLDHCVKLTGDVDKEGAGYLKF